MNANTLTAPAPSQYRPGLEGVVAARTRLSRVDGVAGRLTIAGYELEDFAHRATFEETLHLLWHDRRPAPDNRQHFSEQLRAARHYTPRLRRILDEAVDGGAPLIDVLRVGCAALSVDAGTPEPAGDAERIVATLPLIIAHAERRKRGLRVPAPRDDLDQAENFLYMLDGHYSENLPRRARALHTYWNAVVDHGLNASTFTARLIISTRSDVVSAVTGAIGALKGPLHGGAPGPALDMVFEIGTAERAEAYIQQKLDRGERLMGFGHRIYRVRDPRADVLARAAAELYRGHPELESLYTLALHVEQTALRILHKRKPERVLQTNVEYYTALLLHGIGLAPELFTPVFAAGRAGGWTAHCLEYLASGERILRPASEYAGAEGRRWDAGV